MNNRQPLEARVTHTYVGTYDHLDRWESLGNYEIVASGEPIVTDEEDICEPTTQIKFLKVHLDPDVIADDHAVRRAIEDGFTKIGCHHEYDCCGCRSYRADAEKAGNYWRVAIHSIRNF